MQAPADLAGATVLRYVTDKIRLPLNNTDYARDINGDGKADNRLGDVVGLLATYVELQAQLDSSNVKGDGLNLFSLTTVDPAAVDDPGAQVTIYNANRQENPDFSGKGKFSVDKSVKAAKFAAALKGGAFLSPAPKTQAAPATANLRIFLSPTVSVALPVVGAWLSFTANPTTLTSGQLNGALTRKDADDLLIPALARSLDEFAQVNPCEENCKTVRSLFDTSKDGRISLDEVRANALVKNLLAPDLDLFDTKGVWKPNPKANPTDAERDSISVGVGFHGVRATFTE